MQTIRRHLRLWATGWLVFQAVSLTALVPRDCCVAHRPATARDCHEAAAVPHCPMPAADTDADGAVCPMHGEAADEARRSSTRCSIRGACDGPLAALITFLSSHGILTRPVAASPDLLVSALPGSANEQPLNRLASPDPPPPRA